jgi:23S rRNA pseudouridine2605 synthase
VYIVLHKPKNVVSTLSDPEGRPTVAELLRDAGARVYPVGRLDFATSGVLLATNDGDFAQGLLHPRQEVPKTYVVKVQGIMGDEDLDRWRKGILLEDGKTAPARARLIRHEADKTWFEVTIHEGRNQQIRRMGDATGFRVMRLARVSFAGITHEGLKPGSYRHLSVQELTALRETYGVPKRVKSAAAAPTKRKHAVEAAREEGRGKKAFVARGDRSASRRDAGASEAPVRSARSARSGTKPRAAAPRGPRARGREDR